MVESILHLFEHRRRVLQAVCLVAVVFAAGFATRLRILDSPEKWMPMDSIRAWEVFSSHFDVGDMVAIGLDFQRPVSDDDLPRLRDLRKKLEPIEGLKLVYDASLVAERIEGVGLTALLDPANAERFSLYAGALWDQPSPERPGRTLVTACELKILPNTWDPRGNEQVNAARRRVVADIQNVVDAERRNPAWQGVEFHVASSIVMMAELERRARQVAFTFLPVSIAVALGSLLWGFRSGRALVTAVLGGLFAMLMVLGWVGATSGTIGVVTMAAPALMSIIAIASTVHFTSYAAEKGGIGEPGRRGELIRDVAYPCLGAAATTGFGFLMLCFNQLGPVRDLGGQLFVGSLLAFLGVYLVSQLWPIRRAQRARFLTHERLSWFSAKVTARPRAVTAASAVFTAAFVFLAWPRRAEEPIGLYVDADAFSFFSDDQPISRALDHFARRKFGLYQLDAVLIPKTRGHAASGGRPASRDYLANEQAVARFSDQVSARRDLGIVRVLSTPAFQQRQAEFGRQLARIRPQEGLGSYLAQQARVRTRAAVFAATFQNWNRDKLDQGAVRLTFLASNEGAAGFRPLVDMVTEHLPRDRFECYLSGSIADSLTLAEQLTGGMGAGLASSFAVMLALCTVLFRSARLAAIAVVPSTVSILAVFGLMGLLKLPISSGTAMVFTVALGIAMNDNIHFLLHYRRLTRGEGLPPTIAVHRAIERLGRPIVLTSVVHIAGFAIFLLTDFQPLYHFGMLAAASMVVALLTSLVLLPNLLLVFDRAPATTPPGQERTRPPAASGNSKPHAISPEPTEASR